MSGSTSQLCIRVPVEVVRHVDDLCEATGHSRSDIVRSMLNRLTISDMPEGWVQAANETRMARRAR
jgi:predicted DNA-binding protein